MDYKLALLLLRS